MTGAVNAIEKLSKGLSKHKQVAAVLKRQNEALDLASSLSEHLKEHGIVKEYGDKQMLMGMNMNYVLINKQNKVQGYASDKKDALDIAKRTMSTMHPIKKKITDKTLEKMNALAMTPKQLADLGIIDEGDNKMGPQDITPGDRVEFKGEKFEVVDVELDTIVADNLKTGLRNRLKTDKVTKIFGADAMTDKDEEDLGAMFKRLDKVPSGSLKHVATEDEPDLGRPVTGSDNHIMGSEGHAVPLLAKVAKQIAMDHADQDYTAIDELFKRTPSKELESFLSEFGESMGEALDLEDDDLDALELEFLNSLDPEMKAKFGKDPKLADKIRASMKAKMDESSPQAITEAQFDEAAGEKDACYHKVKSRYKVWPSAYASGALTKCRKVGASNWGKSKSK
jgi:hypothetical protein